MRALGSVSVLASIWLLGCQFNLSDRFNGEPVAPPLGLGFGFDGGVGPSVSVPQDTRPVVTPTTQPPPISGGTLLVTRDAKLAVAADPDRDRVSIVSIASQTVLHTVQLQPGDEPGRVVEDGAGRVHVALRRGGAIVAIDLASGEIVSRRTACGVPRGIAYDPSADQLHVACAGGQLVTFAASGGDAVRTVSLDVDLRDVIVTPNGLFVSRFKSAELLQVDASGAIANRIGTHGIQRSSDKTIFAVPNDPASGFTQGQVVEPIEPAVAWRTVASPDGSIQMLHQYALAAPIKLDDPTSVGSVPSSQPYGAPMGGCGGLVQPAVTTIGADGTVHMGAPLRSVVLGVDAAVSPDGKWIAIAQAGAHDPSTPTNGLAPVASPGTTVTVVDASTSSIVGDAPTQCSATTFQFAFDGQTTAVAFNPGMDAAAVASGVWVVAQTREPATLVFVRDPTGQVTGTVNLGGASVAGTGHDIFHKDSGSGIACASCHAEGGEDGRVWQFQPLGNRRTQSIDVGLEGTAPFHWDGDMPTFDKLVKEVFVHRMGGPDESPERSAALSGWVFSLRPKAPIVDGASDGAARGRALFESSAVGCATCHSGSKLTANVNVEVGTTEKGHSLQIPSLLGVGYRAPFLHDGRAATLRERFDPSKGGGDAHGHTSALSEAQIGDLISYLESL